MSLLGYPRSKQNGGINKAGEGCEVEVPQGQSNAFLCDQRQREGKTVFLKDGATA